MSGKSSLWAVALFAVVVRFAAAAPLADTNTLVWVDGAVLPQEGRAFDDTPNQYCRIGKKHLDRIAPVNNGVTSHASTSAGICYRFVTDADEITLKWSLSSAKLSFPHMAATGVSGIDIYEWTKEKGWRFVNWRFTVPRNYPDRQKSNVYTVKWTPGRPCWIYLPAYNGISEFAVGIAKGKTLEALPVRDSGVTKPVVFYGSSITHGACASRPGMAFTAIAGRKGDFPVVNMGFSGSAHLETEVCDMLADIDASCYVLDPLGNVLQVAGELEARYEAFIRRLHAARPDTPIVLSAPGGGDFGRPSLGVAKAKAVFDKLKGENPVEWCRLSWLSEDELTVDDGDQTVDGCHPNDWGMMQMGRAHAKAVRAALGLDNGAAKPIEAGSRLQVMWDDRVVDVAKTTASRVLHQPQFAGTVMTHEKPWEGDGSDYHCIVPDCDEKGDYLRMYYNGVAIGCGWKDVHKQFSADTVRICYAESRDGGLTWTKPNLGIVDFRGSKENNCILDMKSFGKAWDNFMVLKDENPSCLPDERYKGVGKFGEELWCFISSDGIRFRRGWPITVSGAFDSLNVVFWDDLRKVYHLYFRGYHKVAADRNGDLDIRDVRHSVSKDFKSWSDPKMLDFGEGSEDYALYTNLIQPYFREPSLFVGFPTRYVERKSWTENYDRLPSPEKRKWRMDKAHGGQPRFGLTVTDCIFALSRDGERFFREDEAFMRPGPENPGNWVYGDCYPAYRLVKTPAPFGGDDEISFYTFDQHWCGLASNLNRYRLRQDGFISRRGTYAGQRVVTKRLVFSGTKLLVNFSTSARGRMFVMVRDAAGSSLRSVELFGDKVDREVDFVGGSSLESFSGKPVTVEFELSDADLYSFRFCK
ncbi:MAG: hypothetical protein E7046_07225 [Lentisphaerae bacterium]|nr:hypothetical protein [Lentisphaerota bacterium]